ncbi:SURF1 family protein [Marinobacter nauticus]
MARQWQFDWRLLLFTGVFFPILVGLGIWQLDRAEEKEKLLRAWQSPAQQRSWAEMVGEEMRAGQPVTLTGRYADPVWLLDNRTRDGMPGYEVLSLFEPETGPAVVVNRGWVRAERTRDALPPISTPTQRVTLQGRLAPYPEPPVLAESEPVTGPWPRRVQALPREVVASEAFRPAAMIIQLSDSRLPGAFRAEQAPDVMGPKTHYGYAAQWFALAMALTILTVVASYRKTPGADNDNNDG